MKIKKIKELTKNPLFKNLIKNAGGYSIDRNVIKIFNLNDEVNKTILKNRLPNIKDVVVKPRFIKIILK